MIIITPVTTIEQSFDSAQFAIQIYYKKWNTVISSMVCKNIQYSYMTGYSLNVQFCFHDI